MTIIVQAASYPLQRTREQEHSVRPVWENQNDRRQQVGRPAPADLTDMNAAHRLPKRA